MPAFHWSELFPSIQSLEFLAFVTSLLSVALLLPTKWVRIQWTNWIFGAIGAAAYFVLFHRWHLYGNMAVQVPFVVISLQGAWKWRGQLRGVVEDVDEVPTTYCSTRLWVWGFIFAILGMTSVWPILAHYNDTSATFDGLIFTLSVVAIYLQLKKYVQSWYFWILVDVIAVPFHFAHDHGATAMLYLVFGIMSVIGWYKWKHESKDTPVLAKAPTPYPGVELWG